jgi:DNA-binding HxlR family transcriptional regulator
MKKQWHIDDPSSCPMVATMNVIGGKWKPMILHMLMSGAMRHAAIKRNIPPVSQKMLTQQLRELEADGIVTRTVYPDVPPKVEYALSARGQTLRSVLDSLYAWGQLG